MGKTSLAVDTLDRLAVQLQGIQDAAKQLREVGPFEEAIAALTRQRDGLLKEVETAQQDLKDLALRSSKTLEVERVKLDGLKGEAETIVKDAMARAEHIVKDAASQAALDLKTDRANREEILHALQKQVEVEKKKLQEVQAKATMALKDAEAAEQRTASAQEAFSKIQAQARALTGGA